MGGFTGSVDRCQYYNYFAPCVSRVDVCTLTAGQEHTEENMDRGHRAFSYKFLTPETESTTHFFWMHVRNFGVGDARTRSFAHRGHEPDLRRGQRDLRRDPARAGSHRRAPVHLPGDRRRAGARAPHARTDGGGRSRGPRNHLPRRSHETQHPSRLRRRSMLAPASLLETRMPKAPSPIGRSSSWCPSRPAA